MIRSLTSSSLSNRSLITCTFLLLCCLFSFVAKAQITGAPAVCVGSATTYTGSPTGGTWASGSPLIATVGSSSGIVTGVTSGTALISYTVGAVTSTKTVTVNALPTIFSVTGGGSYCSGGAGLHVGLGGSVSGISYQLFLGTAPVGTPLSGTGGALDFGLQTAAGNYTVVATNIATSCSRTMSSSATITINPSPTPFVGPMAYCTGATGTLTSTPAGGVWTSGSTAVATIGSSSGTVSAIALGTSVVTYTLSTGCAATAIVTVTTAPSPISVPSSACTGSTITLSDPSPGGVWSSTTTSVATIGSLSGVLSGVTSGTATILYSFGTLACTVSTTVSVVPGPASITGAASTCVGSTITESDPTGGGVWSSSNTGVATVSGGIVTGTGLGTATISYTIGACSALLSVTVGPAPAPFTTPGLMCAGDSVTLTDGVSGGVWSTVSAHVTVGGTTGKLVAVSPGTAGITYSIGGCFVNSTVTVVPVPSIIGGPTHVCTGATITLTDSASGGTWTSSNPTDATIGSSTGIVTGIASGTVIMSYTTGCTVVTPIVVQPISPILGTLTVCAGQTTNLADATLGGSWSSGSTTVAMVSGGGVVTGISAGTSTIDYSLSTGCSATAVVTVNPLPGPLSGASEVCVGMSTPFADMLTPTGGTWSTSNSSIATVDPSGNVSGVGIGVATITYAFSSTTGCYVTKPITVNSSAPAISGPSNVCLGSTISLSETTSGSWSSSAPLTASIDSTGVVTGHALGSVTITFSLGTGCYSTYPVTVINSPSPISGPDSICQFSSNLFTDASGTGTWTSSPTFVATIGSSSGVVYGANTGIVNITYTTSPGCFATHPMTVNALPAPIGGTLVACVGGTATVTDGITGGTWTSGTPTVATIGSLSGVVSAISAGATLIVYTLPTGCSTSTVFSVTTGPIPITGYSHICIGSSAAFTDGVPGGSWSSSASGTASVNSAGVVTGVALGSATITYAIGSCYIIFPVTVTTLPAPIAGSGAVCVGATTTLSDVVSGGTWSSSNTAEATVGSASGVVTGVAAGAVNIFYTIGPACTVSKSMVVNAQPGVITGPNNVCQTQAITLADTAAGGTWSSGSTAIGTVDAFGDVTGLLPGVTVISYTDGIGCSATYPVTVNVMPSPIIGTPIVCLGGTRTFSDTAAGGTWSSFSPTIASIGSSSGIAHGLALGTSVIVYQMPVSGCLVSMVVSVDALPAAYTVTGGGSHCAGDTGVHIGLSGSAVGCNYFLYRGVTAVGSFAGTGSPLDFGLMTLAGTYTVTSTSTATGCTATMTGSASVAITPSVVPSVTITSSPGDTVCSGAAVTFTPVPVHGGTAPTYQWFVNSFPVSLGSTYLYIPANGDVVKVAMTSNAVCPIPNPVSDSVSMTVLPFERPLVSIASSPGDTVCQGTVVTLTAVPTYGGPAPSYTWLRNGAPSFGTGTYVFTPNDGDVLSVIINSTYPCLLTGVDTSAAITMKVDTPAIPSVFIGANPSTTVLKGAMDTLTAYVSGAIAPTYQWYLNNAIVPGATTNVYINSWSALVNDSVSVVVVSHGTCYITTYQWTYINVITGINQLSAGSNITVIPNPNKGEFTVRGDLGTLSDEEVSLEMTDMLGRVVYSGKALAKSGRLDERIEPASVLANGMYLLSVHSGTVSTVFHIVVEQ